MSNVANIMINQEVKEKTSPYLPWLVVFSGALFFFYDFIQLNMFNALNASLIKEFQISALQLGQLSAYYFYAMVVLLFPAGMILDRFSTRRLILASMLLMSMSTLLFAITHHFWLTQLCRLLTGMAGTFCLLSSVRLASRWFPPRRMALVVGLIVTMAMAGGVIAQTPFTWMVDNFGWRHTLLFDAALGFFFIVIIALVVRDYPPGSHEVHKKHRENLMELGFWPSLRMVVRNTQNWLGGIYTCLMNLPIFLLGGIWGSMYLTQVHELTRLQASYVTTMVFVGTIIGSPTLGWLSDRIGLRRLPMIVCAIFSLAVILFIIYLPQLTLYPSMLLFLLLGFFTSAQIISFPLIAESNPHPLIGSAEGLASMIIMSGGVTQPLFGWLMDLRWNHTVINDMPIYSNGDYRLALAIMPIGFILALVAVLKIRETYCRVKE